MRRLILDHYRRWGWVLVFVAAAEFGLGGLIALGPEYVFEFWDFLLSMWAGATLLLFDFRKGLLRPVAVTPLTGRQMGRGWWLATVPIPAPGSSAAMCLGAAAYCHFRPGHPFPAGRLLMASLFTLVWLGIQFTLIFNGARGYGRTRREFIANSLVSLATVVIFFASMLLCQSASASPFKSAVFLGAGTVLGIVGWIGAERFDPARAGLYLGRIESPVFRESNAQLATSTAPDELRAQSGSGGIRFLFSSVLLRGITQIAALTGLLAVLFLLQSSLLSRSTDLQMLATMGSFMPCWFLLFYQFMLLLQHLRFLRTLPISATRLAALLLALALLPLAGLGALVSAISWAAYGAPAAVGFLNTYAFALSGVALCVCFAVWLGSGVPGYSLLFLTLLGFVLGHLTLERHFHGTGGFFILSASILLGCILLAFVCTRQVLMRSNHVYRIQANPFGTFSIARGGG